MDRVDVLSARLDRVESELALRRLAHEYCVGADHRDLERWSAVWTPDAVWVTSPDQVHQGLEAIRAAVQQQWSAFPIMQHGTVNHVVEVGVEGDLDRAVGRSDCVLFIQLPDERWVTGGGTYDDVYRREDGRWRMQRRTVVRPFDLAPLNPRVGSLLPGRDARQN